MKNLRPILLLFALLSSSILFSQQDVYLKVQHKLGTSTLTGQPILNLNGPNGASRFQLTRMEYYMSSIKIIHDSGQVTSLPDRYLLLNMNDTSSRFIGSLNVTNIEGISFAIGVDSVANHADPNGYEANHPLNLKFPSMHWGWASGYRFVAFEGWTGPNMDRHTSIHALGNHNYHEQTHQLTAINKGGDLIIYLDADYEKAFNSIQVDQNLVYHGDIFEAATIMQNFKDFVFGPGVVGIEENQLANQFKVYPNPSKGEFQIVNSMETNLIYEIRDLRGAEIQSGKLQQGSNTNLQIEDSGVYLLTLRKLDGNYIHSKKLVVQD